MAEFQSEQMPLLPEEARDLSNTINEGGSVEADSHSSEETKSVTREILEERRDRLRKQNKKLDFEIHRQEERYGDLTELRRDVERMNRVVVQSLKSMAGRVAEPLAAMDDPTEIKRFLLEQLAHVFRDLAENHGSRIQD